MSATAATWAFLALVLLVRSPTRPVMALALYLQTFFAAPQLWWWGDELGAERFALYAGNILLAAVLLHKIRGDAPGTPPSPFTFSHAALIGVLLNATFVHTVLATDPLISAKDYFELLKFGLLFFLFAAAIRDRRDFRVALLAIAIGAAYIGYEVTINERGTFSGGRLEGVGAPGADTANGLASLMLMTVPLIGSLFVTSSRLEKLLVVVAAPLALNVVLLCNSRGAFLGLVGAGIVFFLVARGESRKQAFQVLALGGLTLYLLLGDPKILDRFTTTFVGAEERDESAASRLEFWHAGALMVADYPFGAGGAAFKYVYAQEYLNRVGSSQPPRSLHNGFLTETTDWGLQGLILKLLFIGHSLVAAYRTTARARLEGRLGDSLVGVSIISAAVALLITCIFGSYLQNEWVFWIVALLVRYADLFAIAPVAVSQAAPVRAIQRAPSEAVAYSALSSRSTSPPNWSGGYGNVIQRGPHGRFSGPPVAISPGVFLTGGSGIRVE